VKGLFKIVTRAIEDLLGLVDFSYGVRLTDYCKRIREIKNTSTQSSVIPK
jgi:hypothetical protein